MSLKNKFKDFIGLPDDTDYYEDEESNISEVDDSDFTPRYMGSKDGGEVVNIHATTQLKVVLMKPETYSDVTKIVDNLNKKHTVVVNLEKTDENSTAKIFHFLCGAAYAINGQMNKVAKNIYIITPFNVGVMGDLLDELENNGVIF